MPGPKKAPKRRKPKHMVVGVKVPIVPKAKAAELKKIFEAKAVSVLGLKPSDVLSRQFLQKRRTGK